VAAMLLTQPSPHRRPAVPLALLMVAICLTLRNHDPAHMFAQGVHETCFPRSSCFGSCSEESRGQYTQVETGFCHATCCPFQPPPNTCYYSSKCGVGCGPGYLSVAAHGFCEDLCCVPGSSFWLNDCSMDCPAGYRSVAQQGCRTLCESLTAVAPSHPGAQDGFVRGIDASGSEVYRYEHENQVYIIPASDYYTWRSQHTDVSRAALDLLLLGTAFHVMSYPHSVYYNPVHPVVFHTPTQPYYASPAYQQHAMGVSQVGHGPSLASGGAPLAQGTPVAHATPTMHGTPVAQGTPVAHATPIAHAAPIAQATPIAQAMPIAHTTPVAQSLVPHSRHSHHGSWHG